MRTFVPKLCGGVTMLAASFGHLACGQATRNSPMDTASGGRAEEDGTGGHVSDEGTSSGVGGTSLGEDGTGGETGGANDATGGQGTGGVQASCPAIPAVCEPNTKGCSDRGMTYVCTECGQMEAQGEECTRLITSDKESGMICVVRGENQLRCVGGVTQWSDVLVFPIEHLAR